MATFEQSLAQLSAAVLEESPTTVGLEFFGVATNVVDIENFYIVPLRVYRLMYVLESPGQIAENVSMHSIVIYLSHTLGWHVRGKVLQVAPNKACIINAMDYGIIDMWVKPSKIFSLLHPEAGTMPALVHLCQLSMCYPREVAKFGQDAIEAFKFFMGQEGQRLTITIKEKTSYKMGVLVMSSQSNPYDVSTCMAYNNLAVFYPVGSLFNPIRCHCYESH